MNIMEKKLFESISEKARSLGAYKTGVIRVKDISFDAFFRELCASNACGKYGKCYMCPPDVGDIGQLMAEAKQYDYAFVYQTVTAIEDSFDFEGMMEAKRRTYPLSQKLREVFRDLNITNALHLGAGGCGVCKVCAKQTQEPCRFPELAMASLEAYGVNVSLLAKAVGMKYCNGQNTVTYFGVVLFSFGGEEK